MSATGLDRLPDQDNRALGAGDGAAEKSRLRSVSTPTTSRLRVVTRSPPMRPAIGMPLKTRAGVAQAPIEPGARCTLWLPWLAPWPEKLCRSMTPGKPLPLEIPATSALYRPGTGRRS